jgi:energy-coupling factor transport system ATP-binding protein
VGTVDLAPTVGYLPQQPAALLFNGTVADELRFTLRSQRRQGDVAGTLGELGLEALAERNPFDLSGGERQRVVLAAVMVVGRPGVLLLDEPTRGMDYGHKSELAGLMRRLADSGTTVILATHDVELMAACADHVILLSDGEILAEGTPRTVLSGSSTFATQINQLFGGTFLVPEDILSQFRPRSDATAGPTWQALRSGASRGAMSVSWSASF